MKRCILFIITVVNLLLCACNTPNTEPSVTHGSVSPTATSTTTVSTDIIAPVADQWYKELKKVRTYVDGWSVPVIETTEAFFYISEDGLCRHDKVTEQDTILLEEDLYGLFPYGDQIYYRTYDSIYRLDDDLNIGVLIWDITLCLENYYAFDNELIDFQIYNDYLYIWLNGMIVERYHLHDEKSEFLLEDFHNVTFLNNECYFIDHASRSFSIYHMDTNSKEVTVLRTDGKVRYDFNRTLYDGLVRAHDEIYYFIRGTCDIYQLNTDGDDKLVLDISALDSNVRIYNFPYYENLCYYVVTSDTFSLWEYDKDGCNRLLLSVPAETIDSDSVIVTESAVFWSSADGSNINCAIK